MKIHVGPLRLPVSDDPEDVIGDIRLRLYQSQLRRCDHSRVLLDAPTSSGKTLAYLIRAIEARGISPRFKTTIIVYPTNALMWDQAFSLYTLITQKIGKKVNLTVESNEEIQWRTEDTNADVDLYVLNGETLAALSQESKSSEGKAMIEQLRRNQAEARIILTNPEILYYLFLYRFAKNEDLMDLVFRTKTPNLLVFDEFHLYHGYSLATITYTLAYMKKLFDQIIFGSATPIELKSIIHEGYQSISATPSAEGDTVRYPMELDIEGAKGILGSDDDISNIKRQVDKYYEASRDRTQTVKVLVILSSVMTCLRLQDVLEEAYPNEVTAIHGLVPPNSRPRNREFKPIVVGTSAIELGVDFDASSLIIEAHDSSTFIQRLGRGARHDSCLAKAYIPELYLPSVKEHVTEGAYVTPGKLHAYVRQSLPDLPSYADFPMSNQAAPILLAVLMNWVMERPAGGGRLNSGQVVNQTTRYLEEDRFEIPAELKPLEAQLLSICKKSPGGEVLTMARKMSCRNSLESIPAVFTFRDSPQFDQLSLHELPKVYFRPATRESLRERGIRIPWRMRLAQEFIEVYGIREKQERIRIDIQTGKFDEAPAPLVKFQLSSYDHDLEDKLTTILRKQPAYVLLSKEDWRLPGFYTVDGNFLVVGGDAYLAWYIRKGDDKHEYDD
ncbi:MAG: type I-D CRISPR-associated helicase Cas3' [Nitrososphaerota archaeon]